MAETKTNHYVTFIKDMNEIEKVMNWKDAEKDDRVERADKATEEIRNYAINYAEKNGLRNTNKPVKPEHIQRWVNDSLQRAGERTARDLESIVANDEIPVEVLGKLSQTKEVMKRVNAEESEVYKAYDLWKASEDFRKRYDEGEQLSEKEEKQIHILEASGLANELAIAAKKAGYSARAQKAAMESAYISVEHGYVKGDKKAALAGLDLAIAEQKKQYESKGKSVNDITKEVVKRMVNGEREEFELARGLVYEASKQK